MIFKTNVKKYGGTNYIRVPPHLVQYLNFEDGDELNIQDDKGKHGKFISVWKENQKKEE